MLCITFAVAATLQQQAQRQLASPNGCEIFCVQRSGMDLIMLAPVGFQELGSFHYQQIWWPLWPVQFISFKLISHHLVNCSLIVRSGLIYSWSLHPAELSAAVPPVATPKAGRAQHATGITVKLRILWHADSHPKAMQRLFSQLISLSAGRIVLRNFGFQVLQKLPQAQAAPDEAKQILEQRVPTRVQLNM